MIYMMQPENTLCGMRREKHGRETRGQTNTPDPRLEKDSQSQGCWQEPDSCLVGAKRESREFRA